MKHSKPYKQFVLQLSSIFNVSWYFPNKCFFEKTSRCMLYVLLIERFPFLNLIKRRLLNLNWYGGRWRKKKRQSDLKDGHFKWFTPNLSSILTWKNLWFTEFSTKTHWITRLAASDVFFFFICLHNQLSYFNSIIVQMSEKRDSSNRK